MKKFDEKYIYKITENKTYYRKTKQERIKLNCKDNVIDFAREEIGYCDREKLLVLGVNTKNEVMIAYVAHVGTVDASLVHPREIFKPLIENSCTAFIVIHNHPSGYADESIQDVEMARRVDKIGDMLGIGMLDALIVTDDDATSLKSKGLV
ncbi:DNA repair protein RadC [Macrococcoides caseolyticum]|uniref:JAB domain-containing protein n=2 Tax=Staphylococcaceae TaxID=90964 RepID=A0A8F8QB88_9STAP|nr:MULTISPECIES: JAB domain-containing protein [Macrococcus]PKF44452.1 DNA repair protein RadC [Macrococcus caseolyticus]QYA33995.1 JAB domain-containing protein [Macrococcus sp. 19Msa1099]QYA38904.1 JAB domain-containing protein [Macrococcus caseolyticus]QYA77506.1 JAB domain-containing protein [Macrococcus caseolyticus]